jgi:arylsulfatase A-like enzyme
MAINAHRRSQGSAPIANLDATTLEKVLEQARGAGDLKAFVEKNCPPLPANYEIPDLEPECIAQKYAEAAPFRAYVRQHWSDLDWRLHRWAYCRMTERVDAEIGKVMSALRDAGLEDDTLVVFTSDHGDMDSAHKLEHKSVLYEESVHIPLVLSYKGVIPAEKIDNVHLVCNGLDLLPTLCDYADVRKPDGLPGSSLTPLAAHRGAAWRDSVVAESQNGRMLRTDRFKYCIYDSGQHREQLTDSKDDPGEMRNLAEVEKAGHVLKEHRKRLRKWVAHVGDSIGAQYIL